MILLCPYCLRVVKVEHIMRGSMTPLLGDLLHMIMLAIHLSYAESPTLVCIKDNIIHTGDVFFLLNPSNLLFIMSPIIVVSNIH
jgi:hypothetical protein